MASALFRSPFDDAVILTMDVVGERTTTSLAIGHENNVKVPKEIHFRHSVGLLFLIRGSTFMRSRSARSSQ